MASNVYEIALEAGVSQPTVSQILGKRAHLFRPETRKRVLDAAAKLGYRPNASARAMSRGRFNAVGLLTRANAADQVSADTTWAIQEELIARDWHLMAGLIHDGDGSNGRVPKLLSEWLADGLLISYPTAMPDRLLEVITLHSIPSVWINSKLSQDCVYPDDFNSLKFGTEQLLASGHRRVLYLHLAWPSPHYSVADRHAGYCAAMGGAGLQPWAMRVGMELVEPVDEVALVRRVLSLPAGERPTAVVTYGESEAKLLLYQAATLGVRVPQDLSLLAVRPHRMPEFGVDLSTLELPGGEVGHAAVQMLVRKIDDPAVMLPAEGIPHKFHAGGTCVPPASL
jgi:LacI family transcriptional regulator